MELVRLMLAESPYPVGNEDRRETADRRLHRPVQTIRRGAARRCQTNTGLGREISSVPLMEMQSAHRPTD
jgi:hypothetical protein